MGRNNSNIAGEDDNGFFEIEQLLQRNIQEIATAAGRVEHPYRCNLAGESDEQLAQLSLNAPSLASGRRRSSFCKRQRLALYCLPALAQRLHQHWLNNQ